MTSIESLYSLYLANPVVTTDSRNCPKNSIFIALKGGNFNGNSFARQALELGCSYAVVDEPDAVTDERILLVEDCLKTLQNLASYHRQQYKIPVIGITGTNGKTTTKELMAAVLSQKYNVLYTLGNLNNHIGVPLTLLRLTKEHEIAVIEMGANHPGEIRELVEIVDPGYGLITNVGKAHLEGFGSFEGVIKTKGELYDYLRAKGGKIFINMENPYLKSIAKGITHIKYATSAGYELWGEAISCSPFLKLRWFSDYRENPNETQTNLIGSYNLENALAAICVGREFNVENDQIRCALEDYVPSNNRSQLKQTAQNTLIIDAYNANPTSMTAAIKNFQQYDAPKKAVILGSMKELGAQSEAEHKELAFHIAESNFDRVFLIGDEFRQANSDYPIFENAAVFTDYLKEQPLLGYTILIKGSRGNQLESIVPFL
ncbi:MAG: UDP-N-acetylmuramoyl-tripeptide--D-alanyl-D-alanine ligase [Bacteroidales bacterium]|nr:UDP-N-acetylmuramoyl-tripeptide--D-alanyl-D-alanine ligase [Bacteroidales bacterium]